MFLKEWIIRVSCLALRAAVAASAFVLVDSAGESRADLQVVESHASFAFDIFDEKKLSVFAGNVFVGRVIERSGSKVRSGIEVQFRVEVLGNIKGELAGQATVNQQGGSDPERNRLEIFAGDFPLSAGSTYIFSTRHSAEMGWHTLVPRSGDVNVTALSESALAAEVDRRCGVVESVAGLSACPERPR